MNQRLKDHSRIISILLILITLSGCSTVTKKQSASSNLHQSPQLTTLPTIYGDKAELYKNIILGRIALRKHLDQQALDYYVKALTIKANVEIAIEAINISEKLQQSETSIKIAQLWLIEEPDALIPLKLITYYAMSGEQNTKILSWIENIISLESDEKRLLIFFGRLIANKNQQIQTKALEIFNQLKTDHPNNLPVQLSVARIYQKQKLWDEALAITSRITESNPDYLVAWKLHALTLLAQEDMQGALKWYQKSVNAFPDSIELRQSLGHLSYELDYYPEAREQFLKLHEMSPSDSESKYMIAACYFAENNFPKSREYFVPLLRIKRHRNPVLYYLGEMARRDSKFNNAINFYKQVTESRYYQTAHITVARIIQHQDSDQKALEYLNSLKLETDDTDIRYMRALIAAQLNDINLAESDLRSIISSEPDHIDALNALGYTLADANKNLDEAKELIERAYNTEPNNPAIIDSMGWVLYRLGDFNEALLYLEKAHELEPSDETTSHLVLTLWNINQKQDAKDMLSSAIDKSPQSKILLRTLAQINTKIKTQSESTTSER